VSFALMVDQRNTLAAELEPVSEVGGVDNAASWSGQTGYVAERRLA
jgi:hypothetical protein